MIVCTVCDPLEVATMVVATALPLKRERNPLLGTCTGAEISRGAERGAEPGACTGNALGRRG